MGGEAGRSGDQTSLCETRSQDKSKNKTKERIVGNSQTVMDTGNIKWCPDLCHVSTKSHSKKFFLFLLFEDRISDSQRQWITRHTKRQEKEHSLEGRPWIVV